MDYSLGPTLANVTMRKFGLKIVFLSLNLSSVEGTLMRSSYFFAQNTPSKHFKIV